MRIGIVGGGNISESHARAAAAIEGLRIAAICGQNQEKVRKLASEFGADAYSDYAAFLESGGCDLVALGSPSGCHAEEGVQAAKRGIHVLTEKPIDVSTEKADRLVEACRDAKVKLGVFFQDRVAEDLIRTKQVIDSHQLGNILLATAHVKWFRPPDYYADSKWRGTWELDGGGAVMNQGVHTVDLLLWLLGPVRRVYARAKTLRHQIETEDTAVAVLEFDSGALGTFEATTTAYPGHPRTVHIAGSLGSISIEHDKIATFQLMDGEEESGGSRDEERNASESSPVVSDVRGHQRILADFLEAIEHDREPICSGEEGRRSVALVEAIYESSRISQPIELES